MRAFRARMCGYKTGVVLLFFSTVVFIIGFGAPYWSVRKVSIPVTSDTSVTRDYHDGPFMTCESGQVLNISKCSSILTADINVSWLHAVRALECLCLAGLLIACSYAIFVNCCKKWPGRLFRLLEVVAGFSGLTGFIGVIVYVGSIYKEPFWTTPSLSTASSPEFDWALYLAAIGSGLAVIAAIIVALYNVDHADDTILRRRIKHRHSQRSDPTELSGDLNSPYVPSSYYPAMRFTKGTYPLSKAGYSSSPLDDRPPALTTKGNHALDDRPLSYKGGYSSNNPDGLYSLPRRDYSSNVVEEYRPYGIQSSKANPLGPNVYMGAKTLPPNSYTYTYPHYFHHHINLNEGRGYPAGI